MRITKWVECSHEVEIDLSSNDINHILLEPPVGDFDLLRGLNDVASYLRGIPNELIEKMSSSTKVIVYNFLSEQAIRFKLK